MNRLLSYSPGESRPSVPRSRDAILHFGGPGIRALGVQERASECDRQDGHNSLHGETVKTEWRAADQMSAMMVCEKNFQDERGDALATGRRPERPVSSASTRANREFLQLISFRLADDHLPIASLECLRGQRSHRAARGHFQAVTSPYVQSMVESVVLTSFLIQAGDDPGHAARPRSPDWRSIPHPQAQHPRSQFPCYSVCPRLRPGPNEERQNKLEVGAPHSEP